MAASDDQPGPSPDAIDPEPGAPVLPKDWVYETPFDWPVYLNRPRVTYAADEPDDDNA
jgi:hypothetical protein